MVSTVSCNSCRFQYGSRHDNVMIGPSDLIAAKTATKGSSRQQAEILEPMSIYLLSLVRQDFTRRLVAEYPSSSRCERSRAEPVTTGVDLLQSLVLGMGSGSLHPF